MKKLGKLEINPEKLIKNNELKTLRGGYDGWVKCMMGSQPCGDGRVGDCSLAKEACDIMCGIGGWDNLICVG
jgi:hypothetical protein